MNPRLVLLLVAIACAAGSATLFSQRRALRQEVAVLTAASAAADSAASDATLAVEVDRIRLQLERARSLPARGADAHLALALGDGSLTLERGEIVLRATTVTADVPRGVHVIENVADRLIQLSGGIKLVPGTDGDSTPAPALTIRVSRRDFDAIRPNVKAGLMAYFF